MTIQKVLLVDDDPTIQLLGELAFTAVGHWPVFTATNGFEAIDAARRYAPDVIVLDVAMPGLDGLETLTQLRSQPATANIPVVFLTAAIHRDDVVRYLRAGVDGVLAKPFQPMELSEHLRRIVDGEVCVA